MVALVLDGLVGFPAGLSPTSFYLSPSSFHLSPKLGACGRVRGWLVSHFLSFVSHFFSFVSQFFSFVSQAGCLWSGSRLACLPLPFICLPLLFICLPVLFICLPGWVLVVGFPAGLSPTSFHLSPTSFHLSPTSFHLSPSSFHLSSRLGACGRVPGWLVSHFLSYVSHCWLVSHFLSFVSHFFSFVCQGGCLWCWLVSHFLSYLPLLFICLPGWVLVVRFPAGLSPTSFHLSRISFHLSGWVLWSSLRLACLPRAFISFICLPVLFICLPVLFIFGLPGWVLVVGFPAGLSRTSFLLLFTCLLSFHLSPRLGACGQVPGRLVSHFLSHFFSFVSQFFSLSPRLGACGRGFAAGLSPTSFHLSPTSFHLSFHLSPTSYHLSPRLGACGRVSGWLVSHFLSYVSHFFSFVSLGACGRVCGWLVSHVLSFVSHLVHLSPSSFHLSPTSFHSPNSLLLGVLNALKNGRLGAGWSGRVPSWLVSHFLCLPVLFSRGSRLACLPLPFICLPILFICLRHYFLSFVSHFFSLSPRLGACGRVVSHFLSFVSHFFSFVSQAGCLWSGSRPACLPLPFICLPLFFCLWSGSRPACLPLLLICFPLLFICHPLLFICLPGWVLVVGFPARLSPTCFHLSPGSFHLSPRNASFVSQVRHCWCHVAFLFICVCHC